LINVLTLSISDAMRFPPLHKVFGHHCITQASEPLDGRLTAV